MLSSVSRSLRLVGVVLFGLASLVVSGTARATEISTVTGAGIVGLGSDVLWSTETGVEVHWHAGRQTTVRLAGELGRDDHGRTVLVTLRCSHRTDRCWLIDRPVGGGPPTRVFASPLPRGAAGVAQWGDVVVITTSGSPRFRGGVFDPTVRVGTFVREKHGPWQELTRQVPSSLSLEGDRLLIELVTDTARP